MLYITRREHFSASHILNNPQITPEENNLIYDKCNSLHGHNYYLEVTICGTPNRNTGYVMDLKKLKIILQEIILSKVDHKFLNEVEMFKDVNPTTENIAMIFWNQLKNELKAENHSLYSIKIYETEKNFVEYKGE